MGSLWLWAGYKVLRIGAVFVGRERALGFGFMAKVVAHAFLWIYLLDAGVAFSLRVLFLGLGLCKNAVPVGRRVIAYEITNHHAFVRTSRHRDSVTHLAGECSRTEISLEVLCLHKRECAITWDLTLRGSPKSVLDRRAITLLALMTIWEIWNHVGFKTICAFRAANLLVCI